MIEPFEEQVVHRREQDRGLMPLRRCLADQLEQLFAGRHRAGDAVVERRIAAHDVSAKYVQSLRERMHAPTIRRRSRIRSEP